MDRSDALRLLEKKRNQIDRVDEQIMDLIKKRTSLAKEIANAKIVLGLGMEDKKREEYIEDKFKTIAEEHEIDRESITKIVKILIDLNKTEQKKIFRSRNNGKH